MKKLITILAIMIVLVGAVFADTADLHITTTITPVAQAFRLGVDSVAENKATLSSGSDATSAVTSGTPSKGEVVITSNDMLNKDAVITFGIYQTAAGARKTQGYTLSVSVGNLVLYELPAGTVGGTTPSAAQIAANFFAVDAVSPEITGVTNTALWTLSGSPSASVNVAFVGTPVAAETKIASFTCTWSKNANAIPGNYQTDVILTVTADVNSGNSGN